MNVSKILTMVAIIGALIALAYFGFGAADKTNLVGADDGDKASKITLETDKQKLGYTFGVQIGRDVAQSGMVEEIDIDAFVAAIKSLAQGEESLLSADEMMAVQQAFQARREQEQQALLAKNEADGIAFMETQKEQEGVQSTDSGLQYQVLREGQGETPSTTDSVKVHYRGTLIDGTEFDSSYARNEPATFPVTGVIPGFSEGLQLMKPGGKYKITIPAALAYGVQAPPSIGPNQVLIFEVELLEIVNAEAKPAPQASEQPAS